MADEIDIIGWRKQVAAWTIGRTLYLSVVFSWDIDAAITMAGEWNGPVMIGGPAVDANPARFAMFRALDNQCPDGIEPVRIHNPLATFTTRGCPNACPFCAVPKIEPEFREIKDFRPAPIVCDNNFLASSVAHQKRVIASLCQFEQVDFNQGLDARLFTPAVAERLSRLCLKARFAWDFETDEAIIADAVTLCRKRTSDDISCYVLIGFKDTPEQATYRMRKLIEWDVTPFPMRYQPIHADRKDSHVETGWTDYELRKMRKFWSRKFFWDGPIPYDDFVVPTRDSDQKELF